MQSRKIILTLILMAWLFLLMVVFSSSHDMLINGLSTLEHKLAMDSSNRVYQSMLKNLNQVYQLNKRMSGSTITTMYLNSPKGSMHESELITPELFVDGSFDYFLLFNKESDLVLSRSYSIQSQQFVPVNKKINQTASTLVTNYSQLSTLYKDKQGRAFFIAPMTDFPLFITIHPVRNSVLEDTYGYIVFIKNLTPTFFKKLSQQLQNSISQLPMASLNSIKKNASTRGTLDGSTYYIHEFSDENLAIYRFITNYLGEKIAILRIEQSRYLHLLNRQSMLYHFSIILMYTLLGMLSMMVIVVLFFKKQAQYSDAFARFVPKALLDLLGKPNILTLELGNNIEREISVLFMDIRSFTTLSEKMTSKENFNFINSFLFYLAPVVSKNKGFIDKFIGDAIMALFHSQANANDAVDAGIELLVKLEAFNQQRHQQRLTPIEIGVGINTGHLMLGIIGEGERFEGTVISDVVNTTSRIEGMSKYYGVSLLISGLTLAKLNNKSKYHYRFIDTALMKGKSVPVDIYEIYNADMPQLIDLKNKTKSNYLEAWQQYDESNFQQAGDLFEALLFINPQDKPAKYFYEQCKAKQST